MHLLQIEITLHGSQLNCSYHP